MYIYHYIYICIYIYIYINKVLLQGHPWNSLSSEPAGFNLREDSGHGPEFQPVEARM